MSPAEHDPYPAEIVRAFGDAVYGYERRQAEQGSDMFWFPLNETSFAIVRRPDDDVYPTFYRVSVEPVRFEVSP